MKQLLHITKQALIYINFLRARAIMRRSPAHLQPLKLRSKLLLLLLKHVVLVLDLGGAV